MASSSRSNTRIPEPDGSVTAVEPIAGSQEWHTGVAAVGLELQDGISKAGMTRPSAVARAIIYCLLDQAGRTGLCDRHSTPWVAVVPTAPLAADNLASDVAQDLHRPVQGVEVAGSQVAEQAVPAGSGSLLAHSLVIVLSMDNAQAGSGCSYS